MHNLHVQRVTEIERCAFYSGVVAGVIVTVFMFALLAVIWNYAAWLDGVKP